MPAVVRLRAAVPLLRVLVEVCVVVDSEVVVTAAVSAVFAVAVVQDVMLLPVNLLGEDVALLALLGYLLLPPQSVLRLLLAHCFVAQLLGCE